MCLSDSACMSRCRYNQLCCFSFDSDVGAVQLTELVSDCDTLAGGFRDLRPAVKLLRVVVDFIVVAEEGVERTKTGPSVDHFGQHRGTSDR